jgi:hypothetical protein
MRADKLQENSLLKLCCWDFRTEDNETGSSAQMPLFFTTLLFFTTCLKNLYKNINIGILINLQNIRGSFSSTRLYLEHLPTTSSGMVASAGNYALQRGPLPQAVVQTLRKNFRTSEVSALPLARGCYTNVSQRTFNIRVEAQARGPRDDNWVTFDGEEEWDDVSCLFCVQIEKIEGSESLLFSRPVSFKTF